MKLPHPALTRKTLQPRHSLATVGPAVSRNRCKHEKWDPRDEENPYPTPTRLCNVVNYSLNEDSAPCVPTTPAYCAFTEKRLVELSAARKKFDGPGAASVKGWASLVSQGADKKNESASFRRRNNEFRKRRLCSRCGCLCTRTWRDQRTFFRSPSCFNSRKLITLGENFTLTVSQEFGPIMFHASQRN